MGKEQCRRKLENSEGTGTKKKWGSGGYPLENSSVQVWPICLLTLDNLTTFLDFSLCSLLFFFLFGILGGTSPSLKILRGTRPPASAACGKEHFKIAMQHATPLKQCLFKTFEHLDRLLNT